MNIIDAAHLTVHAYPGGSESLAPRIGMSAAVLRNKVNPNNDTHHLSLLEASRIVGATGDQRILQAFAGEHGFALQAIAKEDDASGILQAILRATTAQGEFARKLDDALADGRISPNEQRDLEAQIIGMQGELTRLASKIAAAAAASRPAFTAG